MTKKMKIVLAFDSFKGSLSAKEACKAVREGIHSVRPEIEILLRPMADGGEGTAETLMDALDGEWISCTVTGPLSSIIVQAGFVWVDEWKIAIVEMAKASGLSLLKPKEYNPLQTTTRGVGELIKAATKKGAKKILLTVGGSATVDGGIGAAEALGWRFPSSGEIIVPKNLKLPDVDILCDVTNPLCGPNGAAYIYGPQKGATQKMVSKLDSNLRELSEKISRSLGIEVCDRPGSGAAGGLAAGAVAFMNGRLLRGIEVVMETVGLALSVRGADWVLSGEGRFDSQSLQGKVVDGVTRLARSAGAKIGVIAGCVLLNKQDRNPTNLDYIKSLQQQGMSVNKSIRRTRERLIEEAIIFAHNL